jgi:YidC/Oxa1 family membrane protein insertase
MFGLLHSLFITLVHEPLYNGLVAIIAYIPGGDVGFAVILLTVIVKILLLPLAIRASRTQHGMREIEPLIRELRERHKGDPEVMARETMALYRLKGINPFASIGLILIQLPVIFGLYFVFYKGGLPDLHLESLYALTPRPDTVSMLFMGIVDMAARSAPIAFLAGITQYFQARVAMPDAPKPKDPAQPTFGEDFARSMHLQMRYVLPIVVTCVAYFATAAVALYWFTSNIASIIQEWYVRRKAQVTEL